jgi:hypothetical protein
MVRRVRQALMAILVAALVSACGSSSSTTTATGAAAATTSSRTPTTVTRTATATVTGGSATSRQSSAAAGTTSCRAAGLTLAYLGGQGATGHGLLGFALHNTTAASCHTVGYPGIQFLDRSGADLRTTPIHTTHDFFGPAPLHALVVAPGQTVSFRLGVTHGTGSPADCATAYALQVIPPNDTHALRASIPDGAYECTTATVSPLQPGTSAYR